MLSTHTCYKNGKLISKFKTTSCFFLSFKTLLLEHRCANTQQQNFAVGTQVAQYAGNVLRKEV